MLLKPKDQDALAHKKSIEFIDLKSQQQRIRPQVDVAIKKVLDHGIYIMGPEVKELETRLAAFCGVKHAISCANGTDALGLGLMAKGVKPGDAIFVPGFTFAATAEVVAWMGASAIFIDILEDTLNMDPQSLEQGIATAKKLGLKPAGIIPVDLFGQPADYDAIEAIAQKHGLWVMADGAQSFGAYYKNRRVGNIGEIATTSFFPAKPLGCYGDGGAIFTNDDEIADHIRSLRVHGQGEDKYDNVRVGINGRLDTIQAAILLEKLNIFEEEIKERQHVAEGYNEGFKDIFTVPFVAPETTSVWAQYTVILPEKINRSTLTTVLKDAGIPTVIYYIKPLHLQTAYKQHPTATEGGLEVCERLSHRVLSFPMHAYLTQEQQDYIIQTTREVVAKLS